LYNLRINERKIFQGIKSMEETIKKYHETLIKEREIKKKLVKKLSDIQRVISKYISQKKAYIRTPSKSGGIPFMAAASRFAVGAAPFLSPSECYNKPGPNADKVIAKIDYIIRTQQIDEKE
jgi:hypothetical protein